MENCQIKLCYSIEDPETAEEYAKSTGKIQVDDEARKITKTLALAEKVDAERTIRQSETFLMDTNIMSSLKAGVSVVKMPQQLATFCLTSPIPVKKDERSTVPTGHPPETVARYQAEVGAIGRSLATAAADALLPSSAEDQ